MRILPLLAIALLLALPATALAADDASTGEGARATAPTFDDNGTPLSIAQFVEKYIPADMPDGLGRKEVQAALEDAGANWVELADLFATLQNDFEPDPQSYEDLIWLITKAPHLDRLELDMDALFSNWYIARIGTDTNGELFRRYVLNYRFDDEPISKWRPVFLLEFGYDDSEGWQPWPIEQIVTRATSNFTIIDRGYFGNESDPVSLLQSHAGSKRELALLVAAALRSQGYATRFVRENRSGESWVEVYSGDPKAYDARAWTPVYSTAPERTGDSAYATELCGGRLAVVTAGDAFGREAVTAHYAPVGWAHPVFTRTDPIAENGVAVDKDFAGWAITAWNADSGDWVALDDLEYPSADKDYPLSQSADAPTPAEGLYPLGPGEYRLECGTRYPGGISHVQTLPFSVTAGQTTELSLSLDPPADLPQAALVERDLGDFADSPRLMHSGRYVFLVGDGGEPTLRALDLLKPLESMNSVYYQHWRVAGANEDDMAFIRDVLKVDTEKDPTPVVIVVVDGKTRLYLRGYNLNVKQWVDRALEGGQ